jgi:flagellar assembly factor FliW
MSKETVTIKTTRFGDVNVPRSEVLTFPEGLIGFGPLKEYVVIPNPSGGPFQWLQSVELPSLAFVICDPLVVKPDYRVAVRKEELASIHIERVNDGAVVVIVVIPRGGTHKDMTANLKGPIIINLKERLAKQLVLSGEEYALKHPVFPKEAGKEVRPC